MPDMTTTCPETYGVLRADNLVYASPGGKPLLADLYLPDAAPRPLPVIVWLHGGGWRFGDRPGRGFFVERSTVS